MSSVVPPAPARTSLPEGTIPVGIALLLAGFATYAFFRVGTKAVGGPDEFAPLASLWFVTFALAPGLFLPLEQDSAGRSLTGGLSRQGSQPRGPQGRVARRDHGRHRGALHRARQPVPRQLVLRRQLVHGARARAHLRRGTRRPTWPAASARAAGGSREYAVIMGSDGVVRIVCAALFARHRHHRRRRLRPRHRHLAARSPSSYVYRRGGLRDRARAPTPSGTRSPRTSDGCCSARSSRPPC